jgi:hypothetical protein
MLDYGGGNVAGYEQSFMEHITGIHDVDFSSWAGWQRLTVWLARQPWRDEFYGGRKVPSRYIHPPTLLQELTTFLGG